MALKKLQQFVYFDINGFLEKIKLVTTGIGTWKDFESGAKRGTKIEVVIASDKHVYPTNDGEVINNLYEKLNIKVPKDIVVPMNTEIRLVNPVGTIYGEYYSRGYSDCRKIKDRSRWLVRAND